MPLDGPQLAEQGTVFNKNFFTDFKVSWQAVREGRVGKCFVWCCEGGTDERSSGLWLAHSYGCCFEDAVRFFCVTAHLGGLAMVPGDNTCKMWIIAHTVCADIQLRETAFCFFVERFCLRKSLLRTCLRLAFHRHAINDLMKGMQNLSALLSHLR